MSAMFEVLYSEMKKGRVIFIDDAFFNFCDKGDHVTSTNFFALNDTATLNLLNRLEEVAKGRRVKISLNKDEVFAPEARVLAKHGYERTTSTEKTQHWEKHDAPHAA